MTTHAADAVTVPDSPRYLTLEQAAEELGVTAQTVRLWIDDGAFPGYQLGKVIRVRRDEVEAWVERNRVEATGKMRARANRLRRGEEGEDGEQGEPDEGS